jgi:hypothetical protein
MEKLKTILILAVLLAAAFIIAPTYTVKAEETLVWGGNVSSSGATMTSTVLESGSTYRIVSIGIFWYDYAGGLEADTQYYTTDPTHWNWVNNYPAPGGHSFLQINEMDVNWGPFSNGDTGHTYSINYVGEGEAIRFRIVDWVDGETCNNNCHFNVYIYLVEEYHGCTPGFWKNHPEAWPAGYATDDSLQSVFGSGAPDVTLLEALSLKGGPGINGAKGILARAATAALLNTETFAYPYTVGQLVDMVSYQFSDGTRDSMLSLATELDNYNNLGCPCGWSW